jgi:hypothetical protein
MIYTYQIIDNLPNFIHNIKKEAIKTFLLSYKESDVFINKYDSNLLSDNDIEYEMKPYLIVKNYYYYINYEQIENILKAVYQQLVYKILNKLVEEGILEMCWDVPLMNFIWRKKKYSRLNKIKKLYK